MSNVTHISNIQAPSVACGVSVGQVLTAGNNSLPVWVSNSTPAEHWLRVKGQSATYVVPTKEGMGMLRRVMLLAVLAKLGLQSVELIAP